jgi:hypothetical protein
MADEKNHGFAEQNLRGTPEQEEEKTSGDQYRHFFMKKAAI